MTDSTNLSLRRGEFGDFFAALNDGHAPFRWQERLLDEILTGGEWPDQIVAPTGSGKSAVVEVHVFANALAAAGAAPRVPRRLFAVVNRRALVDNQHDRATRCAKLLDEALAEDAHPGPSSDVVTRVAALLRGLRTQRATDLDDSDAQAPLLVGHIRGATRPENPTLLDPSACAVVAATPDMFGSRMLFRAYGATRLSRPREAAVIGYDSVLVLDESHLNRQLLLSARRIAELVHRETDLGVPALQVVESTATPSGVSARRVGVSAEDLVDGADEVLSRRVRAAKPLELVTDSRWNGKKATVALARAFAEEIVRVRARVIPGTDPDGTSAKSAEAQELRPHTVGCIVNHVDTAVAVAAQLSKLDKSLNVQVLVGRMRPWDLRQLRNGKHHDLFTLRGDATVDVLVATQTLEVGVDIDLAGLVTELAPADSLAQRFGRVNRLGMRESSPVRVIVPEKLPKKVDLPYVREDLSAGLRWLYELRDLGAGVSPEALASVPQPPATPRRLLFQRPEHADLFRWARTGDALFADDDLEIWLRDDLTADIAQVGIVVRDLLPREDSTGTLQILRALPPLEDEAFPANISVARRILAGIITPRNTGHAPTAPPRAFIVREDTVTLADAAHPPALRPGDTVVLDRGHRFTTRGIVVDNPQDRTSPVPVPDIGGRVLVDTDAVPEPAELDVPVRSLLRAFVGLSSEEATRLLAEHGMEGTVVLPPHDETIRQLPWAAVVQKPESFDSPVYQRWTPSSEPVTLAAHNSDVAGRAEEIAAAVGLISDYARRVSLAGLHHDDGKVDARFQRLLGNSGATGRGDDAEEDAPVPLAKSHGPRARAARRSVSGLPTGWRHEQLSAALFAAEASGSGGQVDRLVLRLVGTSHGHGRRGFPHVGGELIEASNPASAVATELFTAGEWDRLVEDTERSTGVYATAYLEELLRAADNQISREGR